MAKVSYNKFRKPEPLDLGKEIWLLDDDDAALFGYRELFRHRYSFRTFRNLKSFSHSFFANDGARLALVLADLKLPDGSFLSLYSGRLAAELARMPVLIVSQCDDIHVIRHCFELGISDFLTKPINRSELLVKVERFFLSSQVNFDKLKFDFINKRVKFHSLESERLTDKEIQILSFLHSSNNRMLSKKQLAAHLWPHEPSIKREASKRIEVHIHNLRRKIRPIRLYIEHIPSCGYKLKSI